jgi:hypothetical protein
MKAGPLEFRHHVKLTEYPESATVTQVLAATTDTCVLTHPIALLDSSAGAVTTFTLPDGEEGQVLILQPIDTNDITITPTSSTGWATCVLTALGDVASLLYVDDTVGWIVIGTAGVSAPPVISV